MREVWLILSQGNLIEKSLFNLVKSHSSCSRDLFCSDQGGLAQQPLTPDGVPTEDPGSRARITCRRRMDCARRAARHGHDLAPAPGETERRTAVPRRQRCRGLWKPPPDG